MPSLRRLVPGRRLALALALTIAPTLALGNFGYNALGDRERSLRLSLTSSGTLVRDRLTASLAALDDSVLTAAGSLPDRADRGALQEWLRTLAHDRPWLQHVFLTTPKGDFLTIVRITWVFSEHDGPYPTLPQHGHRVW